MLITGLLFFLFFFKPLSLQKPDPKPFSQASNLGNLTLDTLLYVHLLQHLTLALHKDPGGLAKKVRRHNWHAGFTQISIFIWGITPHRLRNLAPQISLSLSLSLSVFLFLSLLWSHSGWSPGWADSAWKAALFNEQRRACEWGDNRWTVRLMLRSWGSTTILASCRPR